LFCSRGYFGKRPAQEKTEGLRGAGVIFLFAVVLGRGQPKRILKGGWRKSAQREQKKFASAWCEPGCFEKKLETGNLRPVQGFVLEAVSGSGRPKRRPKACAGLWSRGCFGKRPAQEETAKGEWGGRAHHETNLSLHPLGFREAGSGRGRPKRRLKALAVFCSRGCFGNRLAKIKPKAFARLLSLLRSRGCFGKRPAQKET